MPDSTDANNTGLKQGIGSLAAFAIPALVAGLFGGGGALGAMGAGLESAGNFAGEQEQQQAQAGKMMEQMAQQRNLQAYRQQKIDQEQERTNLYGEGVRSTEAYHTGQLGQGQQRINQTKINDASLKQVRDATIQHEQVLTAKAQLQTASLRDDVMKSGGNRNWLVANGFPEAASWPTKTVDGVMQKVAQEKIANGLGSDPGVQTANIKASADMGMPASVTDAMKTWKPTATAALVTHLGEGLTKGHDAAFNDVVKWAAGMSGTGKGGGAVSFGDPKIDAAFANSPLGKSMAGNTVPQGERLTVAKQMISAIDQRLGIDPKNDLAALDALNATPGTPASPSTSGSTPTSVTPASPSTRSVAKPSSATPTAAGKPAAAKPAEAAAPIGRASLPDGDYHSADGKKVHVKDSKVYPAE